jgi:hypothetical protein
MSVSIDDLRRIAEVEFSVEGFRGFMRFVNTRDQEIYAETQIRKVARERGKDWDAMSEEEREIFINDLIHEDRDITEE